tara:strand:- start:250 stop:987 length:738 start_codon:yes stop_codon:yes gene_type:complete
MLNKKKSSNSHIHIISHIVITIAIFIFFAIISGIIQLSYVLTKANWSLEKAMNILNENIYYGIETGSILGSYFSIIIICILIEYVYKENIYTYLKLNKPPIKKTLGYLGIFIFWLITISFLAEKLNIKPLSEGADFAKSLITTETNIVYLFIAIGIIQPIFEEVLFRGFLFEHLERKWGGFITILITSITFSIVHFQYNFFILFLVLFPMAALLGYSRWKTKSLLPAIIIHCINNSLTLLITIYS